MEDRTVHRFLVILRADRGVVRYESAFEKNWIKAEEEIRREYGSVSWDVIRRYEY